MEWASRRAGFAARSRYVRNPNKTMPWKSNELLRAAQKLLDIYGNSAHAAALTAAGLNVTALTTALTTDKGGYSTAEEF